MNTKNDKKNNLGWTPWPLDLCNFHIAADGTQKGVYPTMWHHALSTIWRISDIWNRPWIFIKIGLMGLDVSWYSARLRLAEDSGNPDPSCPAYRPPIESYSSSIPGTAHIAYHTVLTERIHTCELFFSDDADSFFRFSHSVELTWGANHPPKPKPDSPRKFCNHTTRHCRLRRDAPRPSDDLPQAKDLRPRWPRRQSRWLGVLDLMSAQTSLSAVMFSASISVSVY